ncbi:MAG: glycosyltransferase family 2 protein [bacterium]
MAKPTSSIIVTNWNGRTYLEKVLPSIIEAVNYDKREHEILLIDDCSTDDSISFVQGRFPQIKIISTPQNLGFQKASNYGVAHSQSEIIISLNNDIILSQDCLHKLIPYFEDQDVFAVSTRVLLWDMKTYLAGKRTGIFKKGHLTLKDTDCHQRSYTLFATGGAAAFDKKKFLELRGFDSLYYPLYWEDIDICYRALKRGWKVLYDPDITMYHKHQATILKQIEGKKLKYITARNSYLFLWKNITDKNFIGNHIIYLPIFLIKNISNLEFRFWIAFFMALLKLPQILRRRTQCISEIKLSDKEVFDLINAS